MAEFQGRGDTREATGRVWGPDPFLVALGHQDIIRVTLEGFLSWRPLSKWTAHHTEHNACSPSEPSTALSHQGSASSAVGLILLSVTSSVVEVLTPFQDNSTSPC